MTVNSTLQSGALGISVRTTFFNVSVLDILDCMGLKVRSGKLRDVAAQVLVKMCMCRSGI